MTCVVDYGVGNLSSLVGSLSHIGEQAIVTADPEQLLSADRIILPGVGAFGDAADRLFSSGLADVLHRAVEKGIPLLGICLGMQLLFERSTEYGEHKGLGFLRGDVLPIAEDASFPYKVPHMGWNALRIRRPSPILRYVREGDYVYYVHSFCARNADGSVDATSEYGCEIVGAVSSGRVYGTQFHPEKSGEVGLSILRAFCELKGGEVR